jgi:uncharacterized protein (TIGR02118 family)
MIRLSILYPDRADATFDREYYLNTHMPMAHRLFGNALKGMNVEFGINGGPPDSSPPYLVTCHLLFDSLEAFYAAFTPIAPTLQGDIPKYTNVEPVIQIGEVKISQ